MRAPAASGTLYYTQPPADAGVLLERLRGARPARPKQLDAFMGLLTCARCGCAMTAERKKGKYTHDRCTAFYGRCGNAYVREERLAQVLGGTVDKIHLPERVASVITARLLASQAEFEQARRRSSHALLDRQRALQAKIDRRYDDYVEGRISDALWARKSAEWETELASVTAELALARAATSSCPGRTEASALATFLVKPHPVRSPSRSFTAIRSFCLHPR